MAAMDHTYPSVYFAYLFFALMFGLAVYFFFRSKRDGYWDDQGEEPKYQMFEDDDTPRRTP